MRVTKDMSQQALFLVLLAAIATPLTSCGDGSGEPGDGIEDAPADEATADDAREVTDPEAGEPDGDPAADETEGCANGCPSDGAARCESDVVQRCAAAASECLAWTDGENCAASGKQCVEEDGGARCAEADKLLESKGMWVWGTTIRGREEAFMEEMNVHGISDVFLLIKGTASAVRYDVLDALLAARGAHAYAIRVWAWVICFDDESYVDDFDTAWVDPEDGAYRGSLTATIDETIESHTPDGIMLDAIRYPGNAGGNTAPITSLCEDVGGIVAAYNGAHAARVRTGAAVMPEFGGPNESAYGQDVSEMAVPLDFIAPMIYRYNYSSDAAWVTGMTRAAMDEAGGNADVWPILQNYAGDDTPTPLSGASLRADVAAALKECPPGFSIFQYDKMTGDQWGVLDEYALGEDACGGVVVPATNLDILVYHQQPLGSNDGGPYAFGGTYEGWCNTASLYMALHSFIPDLPERLRALDPGWESWRGGRLPSSDPYFYGRDTTYRVEEFLQDRYLGYLVDHSGIGYGGIRTMMEGVAGDLGANLAWEYVPLADMRARLLDGWLAIMNNYEWGGHYFLVAWYEPGADPDDPAQRYYYVLDPTNIESGNADIEGTLNQALTDSFRGMMESRQECGSVDCGRSDLGLYVIDANGVNALYKGNQDPAGTVPMIKLR